MKVQFLRAVKFAGAEPGQDELYFSIGVHDVPDFVVQGLYFKMLVKDGMAVEPEPGKLAPADSLKERQEKMAKKVLEASIPKAPEVKVHMEKEVAEKPNKSKKG